MAEQFDSKYFRGQGPLFLASRDASGNPTGLLFVGDVSSAELSPQIEKGEVIENVSGAGGIGASWTSRTQYNMTLNLRSVKKEHLAIALQADLVTKTAGTVTDESHTAYLDKFILLAHNKVSTVVVTNSAGTTTYVVNTDYVLQADEGMVEILSTGSINEADTVLIDYAYAAQGHLAANPNNVEKYLVFSGKNTADNDKQTRCEVYKIKFDPGVLSMITTDAAEMSITGIVEKDSLRAAGDQFFGWKIED